MGDTMYCYSCGSDTPYDHLDAKPEWTLATWLVKALLGQRAALSLAAKSGHEFRRLECGHCYGPGYERTGEPQP